MRSRLANRWMNCALAVDTIAQSRGRPICYWLPPLTAGLAFPERHIRQASTMKGSRSIATHILPMSVLAGLMRTLSSEGSTYEGTHHRQRLVVVAPVVAVAQLAAISCR